MFCGKCGKELDDNAETCPACGATTRTSPAPAKSNLNGALLKGTFINDFIDARIAGLRNVSWDKGFDKAENVTNAVGTWGYYLLALFSLIVCPVILSKADMGGTGFLIGLVFMVFCILFGYCGTKLYRTIRNLIDNIPSSVSSMNVIDVIAVVSAVFSILGSIVCFVASGNRMVKMMMDGNNGILIVAGILFLIFGAYVCVMLIGSKKLLGVKEEKCGSAEEFLGVITLFIKMGTRLTPFIWCAGAFASVVLEIAALASKYDGALYSSIALGTAVATGFFPLVMYINYIMYNFMLDFAKSVLSIPGKIDALKK